MQIIGRLTNILTEKGISVAQFSKEAHIPSARVYKWLDEEKPASPKSEDVRKIETWIEQFVSRQERPGMTYTPITSTDKSVSFAGGQEAIRLLAEKDAVIKKLEDEIAWLRLHIDRLMGNSSLQKS